MAHCLTPTDKKAMITSFFLIIIRREDSRVRVSIREIKEVGTFERRRTKIKNGRINDIEANTNVRVIQPFYFLSEVITESLCSKM